MRRNYRFILFILLMALMPFENFAQFPENMRVSADGLQLVQKRMKMEKIYSLESIPEIRLDFKQADYWQLLTANYNSKTEIPADLTYNGVIYPNVGVRFRGQTSYQKVQGQKKSFNISADFENTDQKIDGYKTFNLLNGFEDPSLMREVLFNEISSNTIPAAKTNFVKLFINGESWGIYGNAQQLNKDFLEEWFLSNDGGNWRGEKPDTSTANIGGGGGPMGGGGFGAGYCSLNYLTENPLEYSRYYTLKSSDIEDPWTPLAQAIKKLNSPNVNQFLYDSLKNYIDVDRTLWFLANEIILTDDDSYINKGGMDYYIYYDVDTKRLTPIQYDANSSMNTKNAAWSPFLKETDAKFPLANRLFADPVLKQRYAAHVRTIINKYLDDDYINELISKYDALIKDEVAADTKKLNTTAQYISELTVLKNFFKTRKTNLLKNTVIAGQAPLINEVSRHTVSGINQNPNSDEEAVIKAAISSAEGVSKVLLYYGSGLMGAFDYTEMNDEGINSDEAAGDGIYSGKIQAYPAGTTVRYYIEARANNTNKSASFKPEGAEHDVYFYKTEELEGQDCPVVINEISPANKTIIADPQGDYDDWIELYNTSDADYDLSNHYLSDKSDNPIKWKFPEGIIIKAKDYLLVWADEDGSDYPEGIHANFKLSASGEIVMLVMPDANGNAIADSITFPAVEDDISYGRYVNGSGTFQAMPASPLAENIAFTNAVPGEETSKINIKPNPANDYVVLEFNGIEAGTYEISVYNSLGQMIISNSNIYISDSASAHKLNLRNTAGELLSSGIYHLRLYNGSKSEFISFVINNN